MTSKVPSPAERLILHPSCCLPAADEDKCISRGRCEDSDGAALTENVLTPVKIGRNAHFCFRTYPLTLLPFLSSLAPQTFTEQRLCFRGWGMQE